MTRRSDLLTALAAPVFVLLWSTGFIGAKYGLPYAEPLTFLSVRFMLVLVALGVWVGLSASPLPSRRECRDLFLVGALLHGAYLGGVFTAISLGVEAGVSALIVSMQPVLTALVARRMLGERLTRTQMIGLAFGVLGVGMVVAEKIDGQGGSPAGLMLCGIGLFSITGATLYQKKHCAEAPLRSGALVQYLGGLAVVGPLALVFETRDISWSGEFVFALGWLVLVLSLGAVGLLLVLIRRGAASKVASLFFLVPPSTAVIAWLMFDETMGVLALFGLVLASLGVALVMRGDRRSG